MSSIVDFAKQALGLVNPIDSEARLLLDGYLKEVGLENYYDAKPTDYSAGRTILDAEAPLQVAVLLALLKIDNRGQQMQLHGLRSRLISRNLPLSVSELEKLLEHCVALGQQYGQWSCVLRKLRVLVDGGVPLTPSMRQALAEMNTKVAHYSSAELRKIKAQIADLLNGTQENLPDAGDAWADCVLMELNDMGPKVRAEWAALLTHATTAEGSKPSAKWLAKAERNCTPIGRAGFGLKASAWLNLTAPPPPLELVAPKCPDAEQMRANRRLYDEYQKAVKKYNADVCEYLDSISEKNITILKGLAWYSATGEDAALAHSLAHMAEIAFQRTGWASRAGNAAIWALGQMPGGVGVGPLSRLRTRLRDRGALKLVASSIEAAAKNAGMTVDELEDLAVPTGGLDADGTRREMFGEDGAATLTLDAKTAKTNLQWFGPDGKPRKAVPAAVKKNWPAEVKALKAAEEEVKQALAAQAARFDKFLLNEREWPLAVWQERYLSHPILGNLARRLIWVTDGTPSLPDEATKNCQNEPAPALNPPHHPLPQGEVARRGEVPSPAEPEGPPTPPELGAEGRSSLRLWHPLGAPPDDVLRWRQTLESQGIVQPFKQAHREVYLLTDAERATRTYSNRFAAHVLKQHQFNSLCILRGWKNKLRLMVDDEYPPATRDLPRHNLRAEFWVEGIGDDYGTDTNDAGTFLRLATDQVRFYPRDAAVNYAHASGSGYAANRHQVPAEALPLEDIPPLVFSEVMRDVDLFVGVASLGNDPTWADGGPQGRFQAYWRDFSFGELTETAQTRADVLARLLPRLKIAGRCHLEGRFLWVRGDLRTYKIHLGSGNILMEPNDQYLCIVPTSRAEDAGDLFLPFVGDRTLAVILSKAFLLADDTRISDPTITRQIKV